MEGRNMDIVKPTTMREIHHSEIKQDLLANLPSDIVIYILSTLPICTIIRCKRVCKSWLALLETPEFVSSHILNSIPGLAVYAGKPKLYDFFKFEDGRDLEQHELHYDFVTQISLPYKYGWICGSVDGLLFLRDVAKPIMFCICNPFTRDYIEFDFAKEDVYSNTQALVTCGFGASKITGQHKAVIIRHDSYPKSDKSMCHIYTLETGSWRRTSHVAHHDRQSIGALLNGNLHWLVLDLEDPQLQISCIDLETELFSSFSSPLTRCSTASVGLSALEDCLCLCDGSPADGFVLWFMKEYGDEKSWTKHFFICEDYKYNLRPHYFGMCPIKIFEDGDVLMFWERILLFYYSKKNKTIKFRTADTRIDAFLYIQSFLSLKSFGLKDVRSF
ncbi:hypothetical protein ACS0TY_035541 [Phlomoides rotata]